MLTVKQTKQSYEINTITTRFIYAIIFNHIPHNKILEIVIAPSEYLI